MKKLFTLLILVFLTVTSISAQGYRKWDFTNWSSATISNLQAEASKGVTGGAWSDVEKATGDNPTNGNCYWSYSDANCVDGTLTANGVKIAETEGLIFNTDYVNRRSLAIAVNYPSTSLGSYGGGQYLWLGGGNAKSASARIVCFTIPKVKVGQKITIVAESHKPSDARGVSLFIGSVTNDANQIGASFKPKTKDSYTWEGWELPSGIDPSDEVDVLVYNTNGCHIYSIEVGDGEDPNANKINVAYVTEGDGSGEETLGNLKANNQLNVTVLDLKQPAFEGNQETVLEFLSQYSALVLSPAISAENADAIKPLLTFFPILNLNAKLYDAWGYGTATEFSQGIAKINNLKSNLFSNFEENTDYYTEGEGEEAVNFFSISDHAFTGVKLSDFFAGDEKLATDFDNEEVVAIHTHNLYHNAYIFLPAEITATAPKVLMNAINALKSSKAKITKIGSPKITLEYKNLNTNITMAMVSSNLPKPHIYYSLDGSDPTLASTEYTEMINVTSPCTVKAVAIAEGYMLSDVISQTVDIRQQISSPSISIEQGQGYAIVSLSSDNNEATIYYNYDGSKEVSKSSIYKEPISINLVGRTIYAFTVADGYVNSELVSQEVNFSNPRIRIDILSHMDANSAEYNAGSTSTAYYFSWGKSKTTYNYYNPDVYTETATIDPETGDENVVKTYTEMQPEESKDFENGWMVRSRGQLTIWENQNTGTNYGDNSGYNFATVDDNNPYFPATKGYINLADKNTVPSDATFPYNAYIVTTQKYQGPFDIVANMASITKPDNPGKHGVVFQVATDGNVWESNWETVGDTITIEDSPRLTHNVVRSYEGTDEVYVRTYLCANNSKVGFYDIYIVNEGEKSKEIMTGINLVTEKTAKGTKGIYNLNGIRQSSLKRGLNIIVKDDSSVEKVLVK